ncbi:MAG: phosphotransferase [Planctomycetes bacterium]|nr:phosphotransferase [Planctomycetota bacterium]
MTESQLDIEQPGVLLAYLRDTGRVGPDDRVEVRPLAGGVSNRTMLVCWPDGRGWVVKQALDRLRVPTEWLSDPRRIHREAAGLRWLARLAPAGTITPFVFEDFEHHLLAMDEVPQPHENFKTLLLAGHVESDHVDQFARLLATIHRGASERPNQLSAEFGDRSFFESLRIEPYYEYAGRQVAAAGPFMRQLIEDCRSRRFTLVHGDYSPKNILIHAGRLVLLDHEVIHFGDGAFDIGFAMTHLLSKAHHLPAHRERFATAARRFWETYQAGVADLEWLDDFEPRAVRHTLGCLLARVAGRSPLEYMEPQEREHQRETVTAVMQMPPTAIADLIDAFVARL